MVFSFLVVVNSSRISFTTLSYQALIRLLCTCKFDAAKEAQGLLEMRISKLEAVLTNARLIDESTLDLSKVLILSKVKIKNSANGATMTYTLVAENEADFKAGKISVDSPIGKGLLGKKKGEIADIQVPSGIMKFEIIEISR